jgi:hypothetical protein
MILLSYGLDNSWPKLTMRTFIRNVAPRYTVFQYECGNDDVQLDISLNDLSFSARPNLMAALQYLRYHLSTTYIWIDAICIDQSNVSERTQQV